MDRLAGIWVWLVDDFPEVAFKTWAVLNAVYIAAAAGAIFYFVFA